MEPLQIIVNADDLGMNVEVNAAIFALMAEGRLPSATILANGPTFAEAAQHAASFPQCSFGVHLNLTEFEPLTAGSGARAITNHAGVMSREIERATLSRQLLRAMYDEWCAQIDRAASAGIRVSHVDSHHHVHTIPTAFPVLKAVQRRYGIRAVRLSKNLYAADQPCPRGLLFKKRVFNGALRSLYRTRTTDAFTEFLTFARLSPAATASCRSVEAMVHPGASYAGPEMDLLRSDWLAAGGRQRMLISYRELAGSAAAI
jgi:predicted glycoside hydrolase/deacetylase ChbG (UPF0249 family)